MNLLVVADDEELQEGFSDNLEDVSHASVADIRITAGKESTVLVEGRPVEEYDAVYLDPELRVAIFSRVFLETLRERDIRANLGPTAFFVIAKKSYLFQVLAEKDVPIPPTATVSTEKGISGVADDLSFPLVGKKFEAFRRRDMSLIEDEESLRSFVEHMEHGKHLLLLQELVEGEVYDSLYLDGEVVSIKLEGEGWRKRSGDATESYHSAGSDIADVADDAAKAIGADICRIRTVGGTVVEANLDPDLGRFQSVTGKNVYGSVIEYLEE